MRLLSTPKPSLVKIKLLVFLILLGLLYSCTFSPPEQKKWIETINGYYFLGTDNEYIYKWDGEYFEKYINGYGELSVFLEDSLIETISLNSAYFGAKSDEDVYEIEGDKYVGSLKDELFYGRGVLIKENGDVFSGKFENGSPDGLLNYYKKGKLRYSGLWKMGKYHGMGIQYFENGQSMEGIWYDGVLSKTPKTKINFNNGEYYGNVLNGEPNGVGEIVYSNGNKYVGGWKNGHFNDEGTYTIVNKGTILGEWNEGVLNGYTELDFKELFCAGFYEYGKLNGHVYCIYTDTAIYSGDYLNNKKEGYGDFFFNNGESYQGSWKNDMFDGLGLYIFNNGDSYIGEWKNGVQNGSGTIQTELYDFTGDIESGIISGYGEIEYNKEGDTYKGYFEQNSKSGQGTYIYSNGNKYKGEFKNDLFNGIGIFTYVDGSQYQGEFYNGKMYGEGSLYLKEGDSNLVVTANWNGKNEFPNQASILFPNGDLYEGQVVNGFPTNNGIWTTEIEREQNLQQDLSEKTKLSRANDFYKKHKESINLVGDILGYIEIGAIVVTEIAILAAPLTGGASLVVVPISGPVALGAKAGYAGIQGLNAISSGIDAEEYYRKGDTVQAIKSATEAAGYSALATASIVAPSVVAKTMGKTTKFVTPIVKKSLKPLITYGKTYGKRFVVEVNKNGVIKKVVRTAGRLRTGLNKQALNTNESLRLLNKKNNIVGQVLGKAKDGTVLSRNMYAAGKKYIKGTASHHLIGNPVNKFRFLSKDGKNKSVLLSQMLKKYDIDINSAINGIRLPAGHIVDGVKGLKMTKAKGQIHIGSHTPEYYDAVYEIVKSAKNKKQFIEALSSVKKKIYDGDLLLNRVRKKNTVFRTKQIKATNSK